MFRRLPTDIKTSYDEPCKSVANLATSERELSRVPLNARTWKRGDIWAVYGEDLKLLADKAWRRKLKSSSFSIVA